MTYIVVYADSVTGEEDFAFYGPFNTLHEAEEWKNNAPEAPMVDPINVLESDTDEPPGVLFRRCWITEIYPPE